MADIELVIKIPEDVFKRAVFYREFRNLNDCVITIKALEKAVLLPGGHGRLIDADETLKAMDTWDKFGFEHTGVFVRNPEDDFIKYVHYDDMVRSVRGAETIIEADKREAG